jgi:hypothetical protein
VVKKVDASSSTTEESKKTHNKDIHKALIAKPMFFAQ